MWPTLSPGRNIVLVPLLLLFSVSLPAQNKTVKKETAKSQATFKVPVNVVVVNVSVSDKEGNPVTDLKASDFKLFDDGKPQAIQTFALESYGPEIAEGERTWEPGLLRSVNVPSSTRPRMISIVIDDLTTRSPDHYPRIIKAVTDFIEKDLGPSDQVAILSASGRVRCPFLDDKHRLLEEIGAVLGKLNLSAASRSECPELTDLQAWRIVDSRMRSSSVNDQDIWFQAAMLEVMTCLNLNPNEESHAEVARNHVLSAASRQTQESEYRTRALLDTLRKHLRALRHFEAAKVLVFFSDGFLSQGGSSTSYQLQEIVDLALRSGVVLNSVDIRGLDSYMPPAADRFAFQTLEAASYKLLLYQDDASAQDDPLAQLANETGGLFFRNNNDLYQGLHDIAKRQLFYYVLTYAMPRHKADGRYHRINLEVSRSGLELSYRKGYYAPKEEMTFEKRKKEDILEALQAPGNLNEIPVSLAYNYYQEDDFRYGVSFLTHVSIRGLQFLDEDARRKNLISMVVVAFDENDRYIDGVEKSIEFRLLEASYAGLLNRGLTSRVELKLPFGRYKIKAVVRESAQGKMGSITKAIEIP